MVRDNDCVFQNSFNMIKRDIEEPQYIQPASDLELLLQLPRTDRKNYLMHEQLMELIRPLDRIQ